MTNSLPRRLYHACWYISAALILSVAVAVSIARLLLPGINQYNAEITRWVSEKTGYEIEIDNINASWEGWTAVFSLQGIRLVDESAVKPTRFEEARVSFNPFYAYFGENLTRLDIAVRGIKLTVIRKEDGSFALASQQQPSEGMPGNPAGLAAWILSQKSISIEDATITYIDRTDDYTPLLFTDVDLLLRKTSQRMQVNGYAGLPETYGRNFVFALNVYGDITKPDWSGELYLGGKQLLTDEWLKLYEQSLGDLKLSSDSLDVELWSKWQNAKITGIKGRIDNQSIKLGYQGHSEEINNLSAAFAVIPDSDHFAANIRIESLVTSRKAWPMTQLVLRREPGALSGYTYSLNSSYLSIDDIFPFISLHEKLGKVIKTNQIYIQGELANTSVIVDTGSPERNRFSTETNSINISVYEERVLAQDLSASITAMADRGTLLFHGSPLTLNVPDAFSSPLQFNGIQGMIIWNHTDESQWLVRAINLKASTDHLDAYMNGNINIASETLAIRSNLMFGVTNANVEYVSRYLPVVMGDELSNWINRSVISGTVSSMDFILRGNPKDFPFKNNNGRFQAIVNINNLNLEFDPEWLPAERVDAELIIDNEKLDVIANSGFIHTSGFSDVRASVEDFDIDNALMKITGNIRNQAEEAIFILKNSPLASVPQLAEVFKHELQGPISTDIEINIPFYDEKMRVNGKVELDGLMLNSPSLGIQLNDIRGDVLFSRHEMSTRSLTGHFLEQEISLDISANDKNDLSLNFSGNADSAYIGKILRHFFPTQSGLTDKLQKHIKGSTHWSAELRQDKESTDNGQKLIITSELDGLLLGFPAPFNKGIESVPLKISLPLTGSSMAQVKIEYDTSLVARFTGRMENQGKDTARTNQLEINGQVDKLALDGWNKFIDELAVDLPASNDTHIVVNVKANTMNALEQEFSNTDVSIENTPTGWLVGMGGGEIDGNLAIPANMKQEKIVGSFNKLHIKVVEKQTGETSSPVDLPEFKISTMDFKYSDYELGKLEIDTSRTEKGLIIDSFLISKPEFSFNGSGSWIIDNDNEKTSFRVRVEAERFYDLRKTFNHTEKYIKNGKTWITLDGSWNGSPMDFSIGGFKGTLDLIIKDGELVKVEQSAGRVLGLMGLLGVQTIPRLLTLNVSDPFSTDIVFNRIGGHYSIENGNAYTNDFTLTGPAIDIGMSGRTGLVTQDYDQIVTVSPRVTGNLPVAGALFGPVGIGIGTTIFLAGEVFESIPKQIGKILRVQYTMKGSWDNPEIKVYKTEVSSESGSGEDVKQ